MRSHRSSTSNSRAGKSTWAETLWKSDRVTLEWYRDGGRAFPRKSPVRGRLGMVRCPGAFAIVLGPEWRFDGPQAGPVDTREVSNPARRRTPASHRVDR